MVDTARLDQLVADVGTSTTAGMIDHFVDMLDARVARLRAADEDELHVAVLSLACSATMLGAERLALAARQLGTDGPTDELDRQRRFDQLERLARCTAAQLLRTRPPRAA